MVKIKRKNVLLFVLIIALMSGVIVIFMIPVKYQKTMGEKYPLCDFQDELSGIVYKAKPNRGAVYFDLANANRFSVSASDNFDYSPSSLDKFIETGDSIFKPKNSDTLYIYRNNDKYYFVLGEFINKK
jgi:hypothetical protein